MSQLTPIDDIDLATQESEEIECCQCEGSGIDPLTEEMCNSCEGEGILYLYD